MSQIGLWHADRLGVSHSNARADRQCGELIDCVATGTPIGELLLIKTVGDVRMPFAGHRLDYRIGIELTADSQSTYRPAGNLANVCLAAISRIGNERGGRHGEPYLALMASNPRNLQTMGRVSLERAFC